VRSGPSDSRRNFPVATIKKAVMGVFITDVMKLDVFFNTLSFDLIFSVLFTLSDLSSLAYISPCCPSVISIRWNRYSCCSCYLFGLSRMSVQARSNPKSPPILD
jgi:hypothetical protein